MGKNINQSRRSKKKKNRIKKSEIIIREYYQPIFPLIMKALDDSGYKYESPHQKRDSFWGIVPPKQYPMVQGRELINQYRDSVEREIVNIISNHSVVYWLHIHRRLSPVPLMPSFMNPATTYIVRAIMEAAIQKYAKTRLCNGIGVSSKVSESSILNGLLMLREFDVLRNWLKNHPQLVLTKFGIDELREFYDLEKLCFEIWRCGAVLRALGKGAELIVEDHPIRFFESRSDELDATIKIYDKRQEIFSSIHLSSTGTVFDDDKADLVDASYIILPSYNVNQIPLDKVLPSTGQLFRALSSAGFRRDSSFIPNFIWTNFNLNAFYESHRPFAQAFEKTTGISLINLILFLRYLILRRYSMWLGNDPRIFLQDIQRAYEGPSKRSDIVAVTEKGLADMIKSLKIEQKVGSKIDVEKIFNYLELSSNKREKIDILLWGPHSVFLPVDGERYVIDYAWIHRILYHLFFGVELKDQNFKGEALEQLVHKGKSVLPTSQLKTLTGASKQIDEAFEIDNNLVIVECRVKSWSFGFERGDPESVKVRTDLIDKCLKNIDDKAEFLHNNRKGTNYDISKYKRIIPIGVTPFVEYIPSLDQYYWLDKEFPRVMTPIELNIFLDSDILLKSPAKLYNVIVL